MRFRLCLGSCMVLAVSAGIRMTAAGAVATPTFNHDVAPIIFNNCVSCHRPNQVAPMSLMSYQEVRPWARAIKDKVIKGEMPPWFADARFGKFRNERRLSAEQIATVVAWVDGGALQGETPLTAQIPFTDDGWSHPSGRPPDLVIAMEEPFNVAAEGEMPWFNIYQELPPELKEADHFVEAIQILPGVIPAVHHMNFNVGPLAPGTKIGTGLAWPGGPVIPGALVDAKTGETVRDKNASGGGNRRAPGQTFRFCCYVPGGNFRQYRPGTGQRLPHDGYIWWGTHYTPIGRPVVDRAQVGLWFQQDITTEVLGSMPGGSKHIVLGKEIVEDEFTPRRTRTAARTGSLALPVIPPNAKNWSITSIQVFRDDATIYTIWPHMHIRGKEMTYVVTYPDGREQVLLSVPNYDYNWQVFYDLKEPLKVPAGSTLKLVGSFDNSAANRWNPAPHKEVYWSEQSWDEMYSGFVDLSIDKQRFRANKTLVKTATTTTPQ